MLFSLGVVAYVTWHAAAPWLIISTPFIWFFGRRWLLIVHLMLVACYAAIFLAVSMKNWIPPSGDHNFYITLVRRYLSFPIVFIDVLILIARSREGEARVLLRDILIVISLSTAVFTVASWTSSVWLQTISPTILARARAAANLKAYCLDVGHRQAERPTQLTMNALDEAFSDSIEYYSFYAILRIDGEVTERNWSFREGDFLSAPSTGFVANCKPVLGGHLQ